MLDLRSSLVIVYPRDKVKYRKILLKICFHTEVEYCLVAMVSHDVMVASTPNTG